MVQAWAVAGTILEEGLDGIEESASQDGASCNL